MCELIGQCCTETGCMDPVTGIFAAGEEPVCDGHLNKDRLDDADMWLAAAGKARREKLEAAEYAAFASRMSKVKRGQWT